MSEICTFDGLSIRPGVMFGHEEDVPYTRRSSGPKQDLPNSYSWKFWRKVLSSFTEEDDGAVLKRPLGDWTSSHSKYGIWNAYQDDDCVYEDNNNKNSTRNWKKYRRFGCQLRYEDDVNFDEFDPHTATPTLIKSFSNGKKYSDLTARVAQSSTDPIVFGPTDNWESLLRKQPEWVRELLEVIEYKDGFANPFEIMEEHDSTEGLSSWPTVP